jgi:hypothetical protein
MQYLQALCEEFIVERLDLSNVVPLLAKAVEAEYVPVQQACYELLAKKKPTSTDASFSTLLVGALSGHLDVLSVAISAAAGIAPIPTDSSLRTKKPATRLHDDMAKLWQRAEAASYHTKQRHKSITATTNSKSSGKKSKKSKKRSCVDEDDDTNDDDGLGTRNCVPDLIGHGPDTMVSIGRGEGATSFMADGFLLAVRSGYFRACLRRGESSFKESTERSVILDVPDPMPSAAASRSLMEFLYTGSLCQDDAIQPKNHEHENNASSSLTTSSSSLSSSSSSFAPSSSPFTARDALDVLHVSGHDDIGGGYLQLGDIESLRAQAQQLMSRLLEDESAFALLRRSIAMGQQKAKEAVLRHLLRAGCGARPTDGQVQEEDGAWAPSEGWWSEKQEIAMCHEVIGVLMSHDGTMEG